MVAIMSFIIKIKVQPRILHVRFSWLMPKFMPGFSTHNSTATSKAHYHSLGPSCPVSFTNSCYMYFHIFTWNHNILAWYILFFLGVEFSFQCRDAGSTLERPVLHKLRQWLAKPNVAAAQLLGSVSEVGKLRLIQKTPLYLWPNWYH